MKTAGEATTTILQATEKHAQCTREIKMKKQSKAKRQKRNQEQNKTKHNPRNQRYYLFGFNSPQFS